MRLKSYFSATVEAAMELARKELGEDALLVNARPTVPEARYLGAYEVVFGVIASTERAPVEAPVSGDPRLREDLADMRRQIERLMLTVPASPEPKLPPSPSYSASLVPAAKAVLLAEEVSLELAEAVCAGRSLGQLFKTEPGVSDTGRTAVALVGPPGVGKTTTLIKLAVRYGLARRRPVHVISTDVFRIAAADQLRALTAILGISFELAETPLALTQQLEEPRSSRGLTLIDTPGFSFKEMGDAVEWAETLSSRVDLDTHLVLSASMKMADLTRVANSYAPFRPSKLIFTRIDETAHFGSLVNLASESRLPVSFLCSGQQIPDDFEEASAQRIEDLVLGDHALATRLERRMGAAA